MILYVLIKIIYITKIVATLLIKYGDNTEYEAFMSKCKNKHRHVRQTEYFKDKRNRRQKERNFSFCIKFILNFSGYLILNDV